MNLKHVRIEIINPSQVSMYIKSRAGVKICNYQIMSPLGHVI